MLPGVLASLGGLVGVPMAAAQEVASPPPVASRASASPFVGFKALDEATLAAKRGGTDVFNEMELRGVVADNHASQLATGSNVISEGSFSGATGFPMVVQNTGNNVLIQSATIVNVQVQ
jgi:hypothetical protein